MIIKYTILLAIIIIAELFYFRIADKLNIIDKPNLRSSHTHITLRGGGIIFLIGMWLYCAFFGLHYPWFMIGLTAISLISFIDDVHSVPNRVRIIVHFAAMLLMFYQFGMFTAEKWWMIIIAWVVCTGIINAYNFMDGINGITGGYSLVVLGLLYVVNQNTPFIESSFIISAIICDLVFCFFNFRKRAKCFAGDVGAVGIAFIVLFVLGSLIMKSGNLWYIVFLAVYGVDSILTICHRLLLKENIFEAHRKHAYQLMANELKIPHVVVSSIYMGLQLLISFGAIYLPMNKWVYFIIVIGGLCMVYLLFMKKYYHLHEAYLKTVEEKK
jgi:UDP-N-acetylmuramyl pentapeptide phosphotransferase/UDP-N-acetylglucosamine-1-phosphate transferase